MASVRAPDGESAGRACLSSRPRGDRSALDFVRGARQLSANGDPTSGEAVAARRRLFRSRAAARWHDDRELMIGPAAYAAVGCIAKVMAGQVIVNR
jgi:hypothetical protein